jgi:hypothetical protein
VVQQVQSGGAEDSARQKTAASATDDDKLRSLRVA